jgi:hypothetical protein
VEKGTELVPDLRAMIFATVSRQNDRKLIQDLKNIMEKCDFSEIERACIIGKINFLTFSSTENLNSLSIPQHLANARTRLFWLIYSNMALRGRR